MRIAKITKIIGAFMAICFMIAIVRYVTIGANAEFNILETLEKVEEDGGFYDYNDFWVDIQKVKYNFASLTNALKANAGDTYEMYVYLPRPEGETWVDTDYSVYATDGTILGQFDIIYPTKPSAGNFLETLEYIGNFVSYIGRMFISVGQVGIDIVLMLINTLYKFARLIYYVCFQP